VLLITHRPEGLSVDEVVTLTSHSGGLELRELHDRKDDSTAPTATNP
jgi:hypothetical protein